MSTPLSFYDEIGGSAVFPPLVARFYHIVAADPILRPLYPERDLGPAERRLRMFLEQYWGGPRAYSTERGHPRLRLRHVAYSIGPAEHDAWLAAMAQALAGAGLAPAQHDRFWAYLLMAAGTLVNSPG